jgi:hypothetical protein
VAVKSVSVGLGLPFGLGSISGTWEPDDEERLAAWEMYVELITRVSVEELRPDEGLLRESLSSLYSLFGTTREILRAHGPGIAQPAKGSDLSFGYLAVSILNGALRPFLSRWHPVLADFEARKPQGVSPVDHEREWDHSRELRAELNDLRRVLREYAFLLGDVAGVGSLVLGRGDDVVRSTSE